MILIISINRIKQVEKDLGQMKSNLNAVYGAIQQVDNYWQKLSSGDKKCQLKGESFKYSYKLI
jgi:prefoldin subunit 5